MFSTPVERKPTINLNTELIRVSDYMRVSSKSCKGVNKPEGYSFVVKVEGHGVEIKISVKNNCVHDSSLHNNITIHEETPAIFSIPSARQKNPKRQTRKPDQLTYTHDDPPKETGLDADCRSPTEKLIDELYYAACHNKRCGWRRHELNIDPDMKRRPC
eukprot:10398980-Ditylum_brightwellii.AAC.1